MTIVAATSNKGKIKELKEILKGVGEVVSAKEAGCTADPEENGSTFIENAFIKADAIMQELSQMPKFKEMDDFIVVADDSGLCVDILGGKPGIYSARYAGVGATDEENVDKLLKALKDMNAATADKRGAKFVCAAVAVGKDGRRFSKIGEVCGYILEDPRGKNGFGYDPVFFNERFECSMAEITDDEKNSISHRAIAFMKLVREFQPFKKLNIVLVEPEIPQNTGTIARTCAATGAKLHLVRPFGFEITDKNLKRAGLDYWYWVDISYYDSFEELQERNSDGKYYYCTTKAVNTYADVVYPDNTFLVFGKETKGLPEELLYENKERCIRIPMRESIRSLNLSNAVNIVAYEVYRQNDFEGLCEEGNLTKFTWEESSK